MKMAALQLALPLEGEVCASGDPWGSGSPTFGRTAEQLCMGMVPSSSGSSTPSFRTSQAQRNGHAQQNGPAQCTNQQGMQGRVRPLRKCASTPALHSFSQLSGTADPQVGCSLASAWHQSPVTATVCHMLCLRAEEEACVNSAKTRTARHRLRWSVCSTSFCACGHCRNQ